jgi:hypothetical protein
MAKRDPHDIFTNIGSVKSLTEFLEGYKKRIGQDYNYWSNTNSKGHTVVSHLVSGKKNSKVLEYLAKNHPEAFNDENNVRGNKVKANWLLEYVKGNMQSIFDYHKILKPFFHIFAKTSTSWRPVIGELISVTIEHDFTPIIIDLVDAGAVLDGNPGAGDGYNPMCSIVSGGYIDAMKQLIKKDKSRVNIINEVYNANLLHIACYGNTDNTKECGIWLIDNHPELLDNMEDTDGNTARKLCESHVIFSKHLKKKKLGKFADFLDL